MSSLNEVKKKIILLGDGSVGKTSLIRRFVVDKFDDDYLLTVGFKITVKDLQVRIENKTHYLKLQIWDILGQKGYIELHRSSFPGTAGVFFVADITRKDTLQSLEDYWIPTLQNLVGKVPFVILANKSDLMEKAEFAEKELKEFAGKFEMPYYLTSAKNGENVNSAFYRLGRKVLKAKIEGEIKRSITKPIESEKNVISIVIDKIIADFSREFGRPTEAMPVLRRQFELANLDLRNPTLETLRLAIDRLADVEMGFKNVEIVDANRMRRLRWTKEIEDG